MVRCAACSPKTWCERIAIESYTAIIAFVGEKDPTTRRLFEEILGQEEEHADELADFLKRLPLDV